MYRGYLAAVLVWLCSMAVIAGDWPTYRHDNRRSGRTTEELKVEGLGVAWEMRSTCAPQPAWPGPAKWDAYHVIRDLPSMRNYDPVFYTVVVGDRVYYGSSADSALHCLAAADGHELWRVTAGGAVRVAPAWYAGKLYFGADDGFVYCVNAESGKLVWKRRLMERGGCVLNNGRLISLWPCRTGVLVEGNTAYCTASLLPWKDSLLCALDAETGKPEGKGHYEKILKGSTLESPMLATDQRLIVMQGRSAPLLFERASGKSQGRAGKQGGCMALGTDDNRLMYGPGSKHQQMFVSKATGGGDKLASYSGARAMVVAGGISYVARGSELLAVERSTGKNKWRVKGAWPYGLILAGKTLFAGGNNSVAAFDAAGGKLLWQAAVRGRAHGLTVANGALYVSTDRGDIVCFRPGAAVAEKVAEVKHKAAEPKQIAAPPIENVREKGLSGRWVFQRNAVENAVLKDLAGQCPVKLSGEPQFKTAGKLQSMVFSRGGLVLSDNIQECGLPQSNMTVEAWVSLDKLRRWGGIAGALQDNGSYERGWVLGYNNSSFTFGLVGSNSSKLTYLAAAGKVECGNWYHVAGTFDGKMMRIYVDGEEAGHNGAQKGNINYPPQALFVIGAYRDKDENYPLEGKLHEVRIYDRALSAAEIKKHYKSKQKRLPKPIKSVKNDRDMFELTPWLQFTEEGKAHIYWSSPQNQRSVVVLKDKSGVERRFAEESAGCIHDVTIDNLLPNEIYKYQIEYADTGMTSRPYDCDTTFNYSVPCAGQFKGAGESGRIVSGILQRSAATNGIAVVVGARFTSVAADLAAHSGLRVIVFDDDVGLVSNARKWLQQRGWCGPRISVMHVKSYSRLPLPSHTADVVLNLVGLSEQEVRRMLVPGGLGVMNLNDKILDIHGRKFDGAGVWTHMYGLPDNATFGGEQLGGARRTSEMDVAWMGRPGPRYQVDRQGRGPGPLAANGRLFGQGMDRILAINSYNGTILWSLEIPGLARYNVPRDCSNWCCDDRRVYVVVQDTLRCYSVQDGHIQEAYQIPDKTGVYDWGYIGLMDGLYVGSEVRRGAAYRGYWGGKYWYDSASGPLTDKVCSEKIFARDIAKGDILWEYRDGLVINSTISMRDGKIYFVECRNEKVKSSGKGRIGMPELWQDLFLVALDGKTGKVSWQKAIEIAPAVSVCYMACSEGRIVLVSSASGKYNIYVYGDADGELQWTKTIGWGRGARANHGSHLSRPIIMGGRLYLSPKVFELATGKVLPLSLPTANCGSYSAAANALIFRVKPVTRMWNCDDGSLSGWTLLRPNCWLSTIPGNGMLLSLEGGGGCSCGGWVESSFGFMPKTEE
jgi:outer membrane protein assembly factor BamB